MVEQQLQAHYYFLFLRPFSPSCFLFVFLLSHSVLFHTWLFTSSFCFHFHPSILQPQFIYLLIRVVFTDISEKATDPAAMANRTIVFLPPNCDNINQAGQGASNTVLQLPETVLYGGQQLGGPGNQPQQNGQVGAMEKLRYVETKTLGVVQIMIGLVHIGFGAVSLVPLHYYQYTLFAAVGGYPFWAGLFFIISGSLAVSVEKYLNTNMVKCCVGMNITSSIMALVGIVLYLTELCLNSVWKNHLNQYSDELSHQIGTGLGVLLFLFTCLEFCIAVSTAHFGCLAVCCNNERAVTFMQYTIYRGGVNPAEGNAAPPASSAALSSKEEAY